MVDDPRDRRAYQLAIGMLGLALAVLLAGIAWVCAEHWCVRNVPNELWFAGAALGGVFVGALLPFTPLSKTYDVDKRKWTPKTDVGSVLTGAFVLLGFLVMLWEACEHHDSLALYAAATVLAGVLLGLPIPSPGRR